MPVIASSVIKITDLLYVAYYSAASDDHYAISGLLHAKLSFFIV